MIADRRLCDRGEHRDEEEDPLSWPLTDWVVSQHRESKLRPVGVVGIFGGVGGVRGLTLE